jgi:hypothetical protein
MMIAGAARLGAPGRQNSQISGGHAKVSHFVAYIQGDSFGNGDGKVSAAWAICRRGCRYAVLQRESFLRRSPESS